MKLIELLKLITIFALLPLLARFKSSDMQKLKVKASECTWNVSASCRKQASPPVFSFGLLNVLLEESKPFSGKSHIALLT